MFNCNLPHQCAVGVSPVCMHIILCVPGVVTWRDAKTKELSDQYITFIFKIQKNRKKNGTGDSFILSGIFLPEELRSQTSDQLYQIFKYTASVYF